MNFLDMHPQASSVTFEDLPQNLDLMSADFFYPFICMRISYWCLGVRSFLKIVDVFPKSAYVYFQ